MGAKRHISSGVRHETFLFGLHGHTDRNFRLKGVSFRVTFPFGLHGRTDREIPIDMKGGSITFFFVTPRAGAVSR